MPRQYKAPGIQAAFLVEPEQVVTSVVTLYPTHTAYIDGEPAIEREVTPEEAERLLAYQPAAYTTEPPELPPAAEDDLPEAPSTQPTDEPVDEPQE